jgi:RNA polymerase sigma factor (sigma-70 family)
MFGGLGRCMGVESVEVLHVHMIPARPTDHAERLVAGDREAWNEAIARHNRRVVVALLARRVRLDRAKDLAQEAWTRLIEQCGRGMLKQVKLPGLAIRQALFLAQDLERAESLRGHAGETPLAQAESGEPSVERRIMSQEMLGRARAMIRSLPRRNREIFELCYDDPHLSHASAAERLGVSVQHVRQTLCLVRKHLRQMLKEEP